MASASVANGVPRDGERPAVDVDVDDEAAVAAARPETGREHLSPEDYGVALRLEAERGERELRDLHAKTVAAQRRIELLERQATERAAKRRNGLRKLRATAARATRRAELAAMATLDATEAAAAGRRLDAAYDLVQVAQRALAGDDDAERRLAAQYEPKPAEPQQMRQPQVGRPDDVAER